MKSSSDKEATGLVTGCTIAHVAAMPQALVLADSFRHFHPEGKFAILVVDRPGDATDATGADVLGLRDLGLPAGEEWRLPMLYERRELISALKPALLRALLKRGSGTVACFEYSTLIFGSLSNLELPGEDVPVVASEAIQNDFGDQGRSYVAASSDAEESLRRASDRIWTGTGGTLSGNQSHSPVVELFDIAPHVVTTPGFAISYWNLDPKTFTASQRGYEIGGQLLRSFDFRGYDPDKPHLLSKFQGLEPRILLSEYPAIAKICDEYLEKIRRAAQDTNQARGPRPGFLPSGLRLDQRMLRLYRGALEKWRAGKNSEPPSPFGPEGEEAFVKWLNEPLGQMQQKLVTRYMLEVREERDDVKTTFPDPLGADAVGFRDWYLVFGRHELDLPDTLVPRDTQICDAGDTSHAPLDVAAGPVTVAGYFRAELGIGVAARSLLSALDAAGIPYNTVSFDATANRQSYPFEDRNAGSPAADINILCVNPDQLPAFAEQTGPELRHGRYTIGIWFWEVEDFPRSFQDAFNYVDEVWVASDFMRETFLKVSPKPVFKFQMPVLTPQIDPSLSRADLNLPDRFIFLFSFDFLSVLERKNPLGLIEAFTTAFPAAEGPALIIKTINGDKRCLEMEKLKYAVRDRPDIILKDGYLSHVETSTLTVFSDCYVSLHCAEGFGLTIAEAMALGKPVVATAYSGNLDFMTAENSYLCPARRVEVGPEREPYPADSHWSEPDLEAAARLLRQVYDHQAEAQARGSRAAEDIKLFHSSASAGAIISERLAAIRRRRIRPARSIASLEDRIEELEAENARLRVRE
jgi:glycosyltransferase involved in cell wall biosynthesis